LERGIFVSKLINRKTISILFYDENLKLTKRHVYTYDNKGLRLERKTYDALGVLKSTKKYSYTF
jgi:hypothetical protein